jgi:hypothetical protein
MASPDGESDGFFTGELLNIDIPVVIDTGAKRV